jgi:molybdopterin synthase catalytic subunit
MNPLDEIGLTCEPLEAGDAGSGEFGAVLRFLGVVRGLEAGKPIAGIRYSAYEPMAQQQLVSIVLAARGAAGRDFPVRLVHRLGFVPLGIASVILEIATPHSREAFDFCQDILHRLKTEVPIWKEFVAVEPDNM